MPLLSDKRRSGIPLIGELTWGSHFCQFYRSFDDLIEIILPYLEAGVENNELCIWVTSAKGVSEADAIMALEKTTILKAAVTSGRLEILSREKWLSVSGGAGRSVAAVSDKAIINGYDGLRIAYTAYPEQQDYSSEIGDIDTYSVLALIAYPRDEFGALGLMEALREHHFALIKNTGDWEIIESSEARILREELRRSEENLNILFRNMSEGFAFHRVLLDPEGKPCDYIFLEINESFEKLTGLRRDDVIGRKATEALPGIEKDPADWIGRYGEVALTGKPAQFESHSDQLDKWYSVSAFCPKKGYFCVTFNDITERRHKDEEVLKYQQTLEAKQAELQKANAVLNDVRLATLNLLEDSIYARRQEEETSTKLKQEVIERTQAQEAMRQSKLDLDRAQEVGQIGWWRLDTMRNILTWSDQNHMIFGIPKGTALTYETFLSAIHPADRDRVDSQWKAAMQGENFDVEHRIIADGRTKWVREKAYLEFDEEDRILGGFGITQDVTNLKEAEDALRENEEMLRLFVEHAPAAIAMFDKDMRYLSVSQRWIDDFGISGNIIGLCHYDVFPEVSPAWKEAHRRSLAGEVLSADADRFERADGRVQWIKWEIQPWHDAERRVAGIVIFSEDITARKQAEEELFRAKELLEQRVQTRTAQLSTINETLAKEILEHEEAEKSLLKLNRLYSVLSRVNEAIVRIHEPESLFVQVCRIITDSGLIKMAWVGITDPKTGLIMPVASSGDIGRYLERISVIAKSVPKGKGPTGRAIMEGRYIVCEDVETDPAMLPWRKEMRRQGFRSSAAFPLRTGGNVIGAISAYGGTPRFFGKDEVLLFSSLADNLSFAIEAMSVEKKRIEAEHALLESSEEISDLYNNAPCGYHSLDRDGRILSINNTELSWIGYSRDEVIGRKITDFLSEESASAFMKNYPKFMKTGRSGNIEYDIIKKDGSILPVLMSSTAVMDGNGSYLKSRTTVYDNTERKMREQETEAVTKVLKLFTTTHKRSEYLNAIVDLIKGWCRCSSVGIRLANEQGDIPFVASSGFSDKFLAQESCLSLGKDFCACTRVIGNRPRKPEKKYMTDAGSFVCNDTTDLSTRSLREFYRQACIREGFRSLAIVPIRYRGSMMGTFHLAEETRDAFSARAIEFIEKISPLVGEALHRFNIEEELIVSREQLRALSSHLQSAREEERLRIAREIHDELGQTLTAAGMELAMIKKRHSYSALVERSVSAVMELIDNAVSDVQRICEELRPRSLDHLGLPVAIKQAASSFTSRTGIKCRLHLGPDISHMTDEVAVSLFRILQEALTNIARHAKASGISIRLEEDRKDLILEVKDNGKGMKGDEINRNTSLGLIGMRERAREAGGEVTFSKNAGRGTSVMVKIPKKTLRNKRSRNV